MAQKSAAPIGGRLVTQNGNVKVTTVVITPINMGNGNHVLRDNETNALITGGNGNNRITERGIRASITLGDGNNTITDLAGGAVIKTGKGNATINLGGTANTITTGSTNGGRHDTTFINTGAGSATVMAGDGNMVINAGGAHNIITTGTGNNKLILGKPGRGNPFERPEGVVAGTTIPVTSDTVHLGNGNNLLFLAGSGNTIYDGSGTDTIRGAGTGNNTFVLNAAGGTEIISGFNLTNGDALDLRTILTGVTGAAIKADPAAFLTVTSKTDAHNSAWTDTVLTVKGAGGTANVTLINSGALTLPALMAGKSLTLPN